MKILAATLSVIWCLALTVPAFACSCEIDCKPGEVYSDADEMCVPDVTS